MGRTVLPFTQELYREEASWSAFRRALRREDRVLLDELFAAARYHTAACAFAGRAVPFEAILVSMLVEERRALRELEKKLQEIVSRLAGDTRATGER
ncbi:MAG: hypothetical protein H6Q80_167 [Deltaproteobacteria bacterium]|jgi:hypothetical protein|nr:hypothetical protein [Deltaproteobacteria bacterium]